MSWRSTLLNVVTSAPPKPSASSLESAYVSNQRSDYRVLYYGVLFLCRIIIGHGTPISRGHVLQRHAWQFPRSNSGSLIQSIFSGTEVPIFHSSCPESSCPAHHNTIHTQTFLSGIGGKQGQKHTYLVDRSAARTFAGVELCIFQPAKKLGR